MNELFPLHALTALAVTLHKHGVSDLGDFIGELRVQAEQAPEDVGSDLAAYAALLTRVIRHAPLPESTPTNPHDSDR